MNDFDIRCNAAFNLKMIYTNMKMYFGEKKKPNNKHRYCDVEVVQNDLKRFTIYWLRITCAKLKND